MVTKKNQNNYDLTNFVTEGNDVTQSYIKGPSVPNHEYTSWGVPCACYLPFCYVFLDIKAELTTVARHLLIYTASQYFLIFQACLASILPKESAFLNVVSR